MINRSLLLKGLQAVLKQIEADLLGRSESMPDVKAWLGEQYGEAKKQSRTALSFEEWRSDTITHVGAAWVLNGVFVRFLEDNGLVAVPRIAGPVGAALTRSQDEYENYFRSRPQETDREYWFSVFDELARLPGAEAIFGARNPVRVLPNWLSGDGAEALRVFFQRVDAATGVLVHDFTDELWNTRFLGDLYQDLSDRARKKYALLQTPDFVEAFILDRTLMPAIHKFEPELRSGEFRMIDPACGSGHFLLGAFGRLMVWWRKIDSSMNVRVLADRALASVYGVDLNPFAVSIARFRLVLAAMGECGIKRLVDAPDFGVNLACGDSLLHGDWRQGELGLEDLPLLHYSRDEDEGLLRRFLESGRYHAVVANPPYIVPKDKAANEAYRQRYRKVCYKQYSLAVPFLERIFELAVKDGFTGQITANSFMKREFGKKLIENFFPTVDLTHVIDTSGAYIPGHGTPTVILFGQHRKPVAATIRTVMGIKGEPSTPENPAEGLVWSSICNQVDVCGSQSDFVSVADSDRIAFHKHPWSIGGGGASDLKVLIEESCDRKLEDVIETICSLCLTRADDTYLMPIGVLARQGIKPEHQITMVIGEQVRDWGIHEPEEVLFPYDKDLNPVSEAEGQAVHRFLWLHKETLWRRKELGGDHRELNRTWWEWNRFLRHRFQMPRSIAFAEISTHNHFVFDRGGKVFKQTAPVIKLPAEATDDDHLALLGLLNSSTGCFWLKQVMMCKGNGGIGGGIGDEKWEPRYALDGSKLKSFPIAEKSPLALTTRLQDCSDILISCLPETVCGEIHFGKEAASISNSSKAKYCQFLNKITALQEELDWQCYQLYDLTGEDLIFNRELPLLQPGQRAFEIIMARKIVAGNLETTWFERHNSTPITELPTDWPNDYKKLVQRRIEIIESNPNIALIEQPEYKRRWNTEPWDSQLERALKTWLLDRLETYFDFDGRMNPEAKPTSQIEGFTLTTSTHLTALANRDPDFLQIAALYRKEPNPNLQKLIDDLIETEAVPHLPILRYKPTGLRKRTEWETTWQLQRQEDAIDDRRNPDHPDRLDILQIKQLKAESIGTIPVPPKYTSADFLKSQHWKLRGKLDVPKERWVSFPHTETNDDKLPIAWAGYNHLQLTQAITTHYIYIQETIGGSEDPRLIPLLASLLELLPWLHQWHSAIDPEFGYSLSAYYEEFFLTELRRLGHTLETLKQWEPPKRTKRK
jgi:hypothetical protein